LYTTEEDRARRGSRMAVVVVVVMVVIGPCFRVLLHPISLLY